MLQLADLLCPEKRNLFNNIFAAANTVAEQTSELLSDFYEPLRIKVRALTAYSEYGHPFHGGTPAKDICQQMCDATERTGLPSLVGGEVSVRYAR